MTVNKNRVRQVLRVMERGTQHEYVQIITESIDNDAITIRAQPMEL